MGNMATNTASVLKKAKEAAVAKVKMSKADPTRKRAGPIDEGKKKQAGKAAASKASVKGEDKEEVKLNFTRLESLLRLIYLVFHFVVRDWVLERAEKWCQTYSETWYRGARRTVPFLRRGRERQEHHLALLSEHVPGFKTVWFHYELDLHYAVWPFWCYEEGDPIPFLEAMPYVACYMAHYGRPTLTKVALLMLVQILHYTDVSDAGRPDLLILIVLNCMWLNERIVELHHSVQSRNMSWNGVRTIDHFKRNANLSAARMDLKEKAKWARHVERKNRRSQIATIHRRLWTGKANEETREVLEETMKQEFVDAAMGKRAELKNAPVGIERGYELLVAGGKFSVASTEQAIAKAAEDIDPLSNAEYKQHELEQWCDNNGINRVKELEKKKVAALLSGKRCHHTLLKKDMAKLLREIGFQHPHESIPEADR